MPQDPIQTPASYEAALDELDQLVGRIESGQLPLEQLLTGYQRGAQHFQTIIAAQAPGQVLAPGQRVERREYQPSPGADRTRCRRGTPC